MSDDNGSGSAIGTIFSIILVVILGVLALKVTFWAAKTLLWVAVVGGIGYVGYSFVRGKLTSDKEEDPQKLLPPGSPPTRAEEDPLKDIDQTLRELKETMRDRGE